MRQGGRITGRRLFDLHKGHGHGGYSAHDVAVGRVPNLADLHWRLRAWDQDEVVSIQLTPTARKAITELHKIDRPIRHVSPVAHPYFVLSDIDGHNGSRADDRVECVVLKPDVSAKTTFRIEALQKLNGNPTVALKHSR